MNESIIPSNYFYAHNKRMRNNRSRWLDPDFFTITHSAGGVRRQALVITQKLGAWAGSGVVERSQLASALAGFDSMPPIIPVMCCADFFNSSLHSAKSSIVCLG